MNKRARDSHDKQAANAPALLPAAAPWPGLCKRVGAVVGLLLVAALLVFHRAASKGEILGNLDALLTDPVFSSVAPKAILRHYASAGRTWYVAEDFCNEFYVWAHFTRRSLARKQFPSWITEASAGIPFAGRQTNGIFSLFKVPYYIFGSPYFFLVAVLLRILFAGVFMYLFLRQHGVGHAAAAFAAVCFPFTGYFTSWIQDPHPDAAAFIPAFFLLADMFLEMNRARAGPLLSVAVALCIACGHTETSMQLFLATGLYFVWGLYLSGQKRRLQALFSFVAWSAAGGLIAAVHLIPSQVYFSSSYVRFWRDPQFFSWRLLGNISRPLAAADAAWLALAAASAYGAVRFARSFFGRPPLSRSWPCEVRDLALTTLLAGLCAAALMNAGLEPLWGYQIKRHIAFPADYAGILAVPLGLAALASGRVCPRLKGLGLIYVFAFLVEHKAPGLCHLLGRVPYVGMGFFYFNGDVLTFTATALAGAGLDALLALSGQAHESRRQLFLRFSSGLLALLACLSLAPGLARLTARALPLGLVSDFALDRQNPSLGGITDPGSRSITWSRYTVRGWGPPDIRQVLVGVLSGSRTLVTPARLTRRSDKTYFEGSVPLDKGSSVIALVDDAAGRRTPIHGPEIVYDTQALLSRSDWLIFAGAVAIVLLAIASPLPKAALIVAVALAAGWDLAPLAMRQYESTPRKLAFPTNAPTLGPILRDKGLFRIDTFGGKGWHDEDIFRPESPLDYGISDFRNRDASDVMAFKNFFWLVQDAAQAGGSAAARLLGLANVKYVLASVRTPMPRDDFELVMADKSVELYRNKRFLPRALFFTNALFLPGMDNAADDLAGGKKLAAQILWLMSHGGLDPASDLLIDASGPTTEPDGSKTASPIPASIVSYAPHRVEVKVQAPAAGWVFLSDTYFPGWEAAVDGTPAEILRAWVMFRAVAVPPGSHTIVFTYRPLGLWIGAVISLAFAFLILALWAFARRAPASSFSSACVLAETLLIASFAGLLVFWIGWWLWSCH